MRKFSALHSAAARVHYLVAHARMGRTRSRPLVKCTAPMTIIKQKIQLSCWPKILSPIKMYGWNFPYVVLQTCIEMTYHLLIFVFSQELQLLFCHAVQSEQSTKFPQNI